METPISTISDSVSLSVSGQGVSVQDSLVGVVVGSELRAQDSLIIVGIAKRISGDTKVLLEGRNLFLATVAGAALFAFVRHFLRRN